MEIEYRHAVIRNGVEVRSAGWGFKGCVWADDTQLRALMARRFGSRDDAVSAASKAGWLVCDDNSCLPLGMAA